MGCLCLRFKLGQSLLIYPKIYCCLLYVFHVLNVKYFKCNQLNVYIRKIHATECIKAKFEHCKVFNIISASWPFSTVNLSRNRSWPHQISGVESHEIIQQLPGCIFYFVALKITEVWKILNFKARVKWKLLWKMTSGNINCKEVKFEWRC